MMLWGMEIQGRGCAVSRRRYHFKGRGRLLEMEASLAHLHLDGRPPRCSRDFWVGCQDLPDK